MHKSKCKRPGRWLPGRCISLPMLFLLCKFSLQAQQADTLLFDILDSVIVTASRLESREGGQPFSLSVLSREQIQEGQQQLTLDEALAGVPGLFMMGADNFFFFFRLYFHSEMNRIVYRSRKQHSYFRDEHIAQGVLPSHEIQMS